MDILLVILLIISIYFNLKYRKIAFYDSMSGLLSRKQFDNDTKNLKLNRVGDNNILILIDVDDFKGINDHYGHAFGDTVIGGLGKCIKTSLRASDRAYRIGGDEFAVITNGEGIGLQLQLASKIRISVGEVNICHFNTFNEAFIAADKKLYKNKLIIA